MGEEEEGERRGSREGGGGGDGCAAAEWLVDACEERRASEATLTRRMGWEGMRRGVVVVVVVRGEVCRCVD